MTTVRARGRGAAAALRHPVALVLAAWVVTQLCLVVSGPAAVRLLGVDGRGELAFSFAVILLASQVGLLGLPAAITWFSATGDTPVWRILGSIRGTIAVQLLATAALAAATLALVSRVGSPDPASARTVALVAVGAAVVVAGRLVVTGLQAEQRLRAFAVSQPIPPLWYAGSLLVLLILGVDHVIVVLALYVVGWALCAGVAARLLRATATASAQAHPADAAPGPSPSAVTRFARRAAFATASPTDQFGVDQLLVGALLGHLALGFYSIGLAFESVTLLPLLFLGTFVGPRIARSAADERLATSRRWLVGSAALGVSVGVAVQLAIPFVLPLAFGDEARGAELTAHLLAAAGTLLGQRTLNNTALQAVGMPGASTRVEAAAFLTMVLGVVALGTRFGVEGAACGLLLAGLVANGLQLRCFARMAAGRYGPPIADVGEPEQHPAQRR